MLIINSFIRLESKPNVLALFTISMQQRELHLTPRAWECDVEVTTAAERKRACRKNGVYSLLKKRNQYLCMGLLSPTCNCSWSATKALLKSSGFIILSARATKSVGDPNDLGNFDLRDSYMTPLLPVFWPIHSAIFAITPLTGSRYGYVTYHSALSTATAALP